MRSYRPLLIVDSDNDFLTAIKTDPESKLTPPILAANGRDAQLVLANREQPLSAVFVNLTVRDNDGASVIRASHLHRPAMPIYLIYDDLQPLTKTELAHLSIQMVIKKPVNYRNLLELATPAALLFNKEAALEVAKQNDDPLNAVAESADGDKDFVPIRAETFLAGSKSFFDLYVRIGSGKFVKILQADDCFLPERIQNYVKKGVNYFYLRREAQERYLTYCDKIATALLSKPQVPLAISMKQTLSHGEEVLKFLRNNGLSESSISHSNQFIENVSLLANKLRLHAHPAISAYLSDIASFEHGIATSIFASLLIIPLNMRHSKPVHIFGIAALLHDVGLYGMEEGFHEEDESKMSREQLAVFSTHPMKGAELLREVRGIEPGAIQAIEQHHRRRNGQKASGPSGKGPITQVAEIIGLAEEFARLLAQSKKDPGVNVLKEMEIIVCPGFSQATVQAFQEVFLGHLVT